MNILEVQYKKLQIQVERVCRKKHGKEVKSVTVKLSPYTDEQLIVHVHTNEGKMKSYYIPSLRLKQIVQHIWRTNAI